MNIFLQTENYDYFTNHESSITELLLELILLLYITGNHWLNEINPRLMHNSLEADENRMSDFMMDYVDFETLKQRPSPRVMTSHLPYRNVPTKHLADGGKFIHIIRNRFPPLFGWSFCRRRNPGIPCLPWQFFKGRYHQLTCSRNETSKISFKWSKKYFQWQYKSLLRKA